jgi:tetratricopeptide (TPR) repeat protein
MAKKKAEIELNAPSNLDSRSALYARMGLQAKASDQDVESAYTRILEFLSSVPAPLRLWAKAQIAELDETFAMLAVPVAELDAMERVELPKEETPVKVKISNPQRKKYVKIAAVAAAAFLVIGVYKVGGSQSVGTANAKSVADASSQSGSNTATIDQTRVTELMGKISANSRDIVSLQSLGDIYFAATEYKTAALWESKILEVDASNKTALLALGAAEFNSGNSKDAEKAWKKAASLYPNLAEVHYDLGFLYLSQTPPNNAKVLLEWNKVISIDPNSAVAKTVATHLKSLESASSTTGTKK